jgi:hypothetical protein
LPGPWDSSARKWAEAELIWEERRGKTFEKLSREIKAAGGRGSSLGYLSRMERAWRWVLANPARERPPFNEVYNSEEIQEGSPDRRRRSPRSGPDHERKGRPTTYRGILMRSRLEADYAAALDRIGADWEYEPECFASGDGQWLPDFYVNGVWTELKPSDLTATEIAAQIRRISVIWESEPEAVARLTLWQFRAGAALVITGRNGTWDTSVSAA